MKYIRLPILFIVLLIIVTSCNHQLNNKNIKLNGNVRISGAFALYPMAQQWAEEFQKENPEVIIDISAGGAGKGISDVLSGMVDLAMVSREIRPEEIKKGAWYIAVTKDAVLPVINTNNPMKVQLLAKGITCTQLEYIFTKNNKQTWGSIVKTQNNNPINVYTRSDACGAAEMWAKFFKKKQEDLKGTGIFGDPGVADAVSKDKFGIGYNNIIYVFNPKTGKPNEGIIPLPIDLNENGFLDTSETFYGSLKEITNAVRDGKYPSPPARELYFVSKGKPTKPEVLAFLNWVLTKGQQMVEKAGYVKLNEQRIKEESKKLE